MKKFLVFFVIITYAVTFISLAQTEDVFDTQKRIFSKIEKIESQKGVFISGRAKFQYEYFTATGPAVDTNSMIAGTKPMIQSDIQIEARPASFIKAGTILRVQNDLEGFYGTGDLFEARKIWLEAILFRFIKIRFGDFNISLSPLSFWTETDDSVYDAMLFRLQREDSVYQAELTEYNDLPLSGIKIDFGFDANTGLPGAIGKIIPTSYDFKGYVSRIDTQSASGAYDRYMFGANLSAVNLPVFSSSLNGNFIYDIEPTQVSSNVKNLLGNNVVTASIFFNPLGAFKDLYILELSGEVGISSVRTNRKNNDVISDYGLVGKVSLGYSATKLWIKRIDVGNEYYAPAAQSWSRNRGRGDYLSSQDLESSLFFPVYDTRVHIVRRWDKPLDLTSPMGDATPNRQGYGLGFLTKDLSFFEGFFEYGLYQEIRPVGVTNKRSFNTLDTGVKFSFDKLINFKYLPVITGLFKYERLIRKEDLSNSTNKDAEDLTTRIITIGMELPIFKKLTLLAAYERSFHKGNCFFDDNDVSSVPLRITTHVPYSAKKNVEVVSCGFLYQFLKKGKFRLDYTFLSYKSLVSNEKNYDFHRISSFYEILF